METLDIINLVNAIAASVVFGLLVYRGRMHYRNFSLREKVFQNGMLLYAFAASFASFEGFAVETHKSITPFIILAANIYAVRAVISYHKMMFEPQD